MTHGDVALLQALHHEHGPALWSFCLRLTGNDRARAEDLVQETLLRAWRHQGRLSEQQGSVRSWLFTVARNVCVDQWRARQARPELVTADVPEPRTGEGDRTDELLLSWVVAEAMRSLSVDHRAVLLESYYAGRSIAETASRLGVPEGTVKSRLHYALRALRLALEEMGVVT